MLSLTFYYTSMYNKISQVWKFSSNGIILLKKYLLHLMGQRQFDPTSGWLVSTKQVKYCMRKTKISLESLSRIPCAISSDVPQKETISIWIFLGDPTTFSLLDSTCNLKWCTIKETISIWIVLGDPFPSRNHRVQCTATIQRVTNTNPYCTSEVPTAYLLEVQVHFLLRQL